MQYVGTGRLGITQSVTYAGTAGVIMNPIGSSVTRIRVVVTSDAFVKIDGNPTATTSDAYVPAFSAEYFTCTPGQKVSALQVSSGGSLYVTEII